MDILKRRAEFRRWLTDCIQNAKDNLALSEEEVIICMQEVITALVLSKYAQDIRKESCGR